jgi:hypothetical protein
VGDVAELDHPDLEDLAGFVRDREQRRVWSNDTELLATAVELLDAILKRLEAGVQVGVADKFRAPGKVEPVPRPPWVKPAGPKEIVVTPRELFKRMAG